jgi:hypothetical protein
MPPNAMPNASTDSTDHVQLNSKAKKEFFCFVLYCYSILHIFQHPNAKIYPVWRMSSGKGTKAEGVLALPTPHFPVNPNRLQDVCR